MTTGNTEALARPGLDERQGVETRSVVTLRPPVGGVPAWQHPVDHTAACVLCEWAYGNQLVSVARYEKAVTYSFGSSDVVQVVDWVHKHRIDVQHRRALLFYEKSR